MNIQSAATALILLLIATFASANEALVEREPIHLADGVVLDGTYFNPNRPGPGLLFLNMCDPNANKDEWKDVAKLLAESGFHVLTFDYRGFGASEGSRPSNLESVEQAMVYWRENWMGDVHTAYQALATKEGVQVTNMGIAGASCGVFMGLEVALSNKSIKSLALLGGPTEKAQNERLREHNSLPILIITGDEGPSIEWSDAVFSASTNNKTRIHKYKFVTHGTKIFRFEPDTKKMLINWFKATLLSS